MLKRTGRMHRADPSTLVQLRLKVMCRTESAYPNSLKEEPSMSGYEGDASGNRPAGLNVDGGAVKEPLKPTASGKADVASPTFDRNSMVCYCDCNPGMAPHAKLGHACCQCAVHSTLTTFNTHRL